MNEFYKSVYDVVKQIPKGSVLTYGGVAARCGRPRASRIVGRALHNNPERGVIPCHRVVFKDGSLTPSFAFGGAGVQKSLLEAEGVRFSGDKVVFD
jgi:methylated-DNA-protein-cysteine methyltransferase-like protein